MPGMLPRRRSAASSGEDGGGTADPCDDPVPGGNPPAYRGTATATPVTGPSPLVMTLDIDLSTLPANARITNVTAQYGFVGPATITDPGGSTSTASGDIYVINWGPVGLAQLRGAWSGNPQQPVKMEARAEFTQMFGTLSLVDFDLGAAGPEN